MPGRARLHALVAAFADVAAQRLRHDIRHSRYLRSGDRRPATGDRRPPTANRQPPTDNRQPTTDNRGRPPPAGTATKKKKAPRRFDQLFISRFCRPTLMMSPTAMPSVVSAVPP